MCLLIFAKHQKFILGTSIIFKILFSQSTTYFCHKSFLIVKAFVIAIFLFFSLPMCLYAQEANVPQGLIPTIDSLKQVTTITNMYNIILNSNFLVNSKGTAQSLNIVPKTTEKKQPFFYLILFLFLVLGITRTFYSRYFSTLFRVFFNTSLRQNQLTDQLEQAKLPSLIFNIFFVSTTGLYSYFLLHYFYSNHEKLDWYVLFVCIAAIAICYLVKYLSLKCIGWVTNYSAEADTYIFIIFLLNKVIGIFLLPIITLMAFSTYQVASFAILVSVIFIIILFIIRFLRSYSLLQNRLKISKFHFFLYIIGLEILPIALIYKAVAIFFGIKA
jgi:Domain of unknown function (DUF4271)